MHCHASRNKSCQAAMLSVESCFTVKASEPEPKLACGNAAGHEPKEKALVANLLGTATASLRFATASNRRAISQNWQPLSNLPRSGNFWILLYIGIDTRLIHDFDDCSAFRVQM